MKKVICFLLVLMMLLVCPACQMAEEFKGGLAHITGTETPPPDMFTPTVTEQPEAEKPAEEKPNAVLLQEVTDGEGEDAGFDNLTGEDGDTIKERTDAKELCAMINEKYSPNTLYAVADCKYAQSWTEKDFMDEKYDAELDSLVYEIPFNLRAIKNGKPLSNKEFIEQYGEEFADELSQIATYLQLNEYSHGNNYIAIPENITLSIDADWLNNFSKSVKEDRKNNSCIQRCCVDTGSSMVYIDGDNHIRVRVITLTKVEKPAPKQTADTDGKWLGAVDEVVFDYDATEKILKKAWFTGVSSLWIVENEQFSAFLDDMWKNY